MSDATALCTSACAQAGRQAGHSTLHISRSGHSRQQGQLNIVLCDADLQHALNSRCDGDRDDHRF